MGPTRPRPPTRWGPLRLLAAYGLGAVLISVPVNALGSGGPVGLSDRSLVALVSGVGQGFALDRDGEILRIGADGSVQPTGSVGHYSTPFGTSVAGRAVFGGTRCDGAACEQRVGEVAVLDGAGRIDSTVVVARSSGWPSRLNGLALVGTDGDTVWVNGGGQLHQVAVGAVAGGGGPAQVVDEVPWPGGEPCVVAGRLYDLAPSGGITGQQGAWLGAGPGARPGARPGAAAPRFRLRLRRWTGDRWSSIPGGTTSMPNGQNAYCTSTGYEIRDATGPHAEWTPTVGAWHPPDPVAATTATATGSTATGNPVTEATGTTGPARSATGTAATVAASPAG
ncbi:MAG TPA: hypothetical protein VGO78_20800, partial [Acidimicrobiales bacterium]|nr:hypothetical protein [Acidimicrobiales bacterium]